MTRIFFIRPVHAVLIFLGGLAVVIPILANLEPQEKAVAAKRAFVSPERPIDRIIAGKALGSRPAIPTREAWGGVASSPKMPRLVLPAQPSVEIRDAAPDIRDARLAIEPPRFSVPKGRNPGAATRQADLIEEPRRKPKRSATKEFVVVN